MNLDTQSGHFRPNDPIEGYNIPIKFAFIPEIRILAQYEHHT